MAEWINLDLLYRGTRNGISVEAFHNECNYKGPAWAYLKTKKDMQF